ncbi:MAG: hypothetical protein M1831_002237 [Alyxoria varia]|nr:MAG: hypothetical protein M1831_002237 [Alyxoria varia]
MAQMVLGSAEDVELATTGLKAPETLNLKEPLGRATAVDAVYREGRHIFPKASVRWRKPFFRPCRDDLKVPPKALRWLQPSTAVGSE